jgi:hypothetical protein
MPVHSTTQQRKTDYMTTCVRARARARVCSLPPSPAPSKGLGLGGAGASITSDEVAVTPCATV